MKPSDVLDEVKELKVAGQPFAVATVVPTVALTAAKAGARARRSEGTISVGWIGGGCARAAVLQAACEALQDGQPVLSRCCLATCYATSAWRRDNARKAFSFLAAIVELRGWRTPPGKLSETRSTRS
jgi:hypothetical protein